MTATAESFGRVANSSQFSGYPRSELAPEDNVALDRPLNYHQVMEEGEDRQPVLGTPWHQKNSPPQRDPMPPTSLGDVPEEVAAAHRAQNARYPLH